MESIDESIEELRTTFRTGCTGIHSDVCSKYVSCERHQNKLLDDIESEVVKMKDFINRLHEAAEKREDVTLFDVDYTACPRDVDGEQWHIGDLAQSVLFPTIKPKKVCGFGTINGKPVVFYVIESGDGHSSEKHQGWDYAESVRHHHAPTVEGVLRDFLMRCETLTLGGYKDIPQGTFNEYAAKLRLAGDE